MRKSTITIAVIALLVLVVGATCASRYNRLVSLDQQVKAQWAEVETVYQRRADLVDNLVSIVKGAANFEKTTYIGVTEARSHAVQVTAGATDAPNNPAKLHEFQAAQDALSAQLSHLMVSVEAYPDLKATQNFRDLQAQYEGSENRITVEQQRFNQAAMQFNTVRDSFPTNLFAGFFGSRFQEKAYFTAQPGAETAPKIQF